MKHRLRSFFVWLLVLLQCVSLLPASVLVAGVKGSISSSFTYDKTDYTVTVIDVYYSSISTQTVRQVDTYAKGDTYSYDALTPPSGYRLGSAGNVTGVVDSDKTVYFRYDKISNPYVTFSLGERLCNYLNEYIQSHPNKNTGKPVTDRVFSPTEVISRNNVSLGGTSYIYLYSTDLNYALNGFMPNTIKNISSFCTYYYDEDEGWSSSCYYVGNSVAGLSEDPYFEIVNTYDEKYYVPLETNMQSYYSYTVKITLPEDTPIDMDTMECCHVVLDIDGFNFVERKVIGGVFRTVIDEMDTEDEVSEWYKVTEEANRGKYWYNWYDGRFVGSMAAVQQNPNDFTLVEDGVGIAQQDGYSLIYYGRDKDTNEDVVRYGNGTDFEIPAVPTIEGYRCTNPDSPREFEFMDSACYSYNSPATGYYYDYAPTVTYAITVKDKFVDESGIEEKTDLRLTDYVSDDDRYSYNALDPIPEGYKLVSEPNVSDTPTEDKEIVFVYQKMPKHTVTVKDKYVTASGKEIKTDVRQEDSLYEGRAYSYGALDPMPEGYEVVSAVSYAGTVAADTEVVFVYQKEPDIYTVAVKDKYLDESGEEVKTDMRLTVSLPECTKYTYSALNPLPDGYRLVSELDVSGTLSEDMEIVFVYQETAETVSIYTVIVKDMYIDANGNIEKTATRLSVSLPEGTSYTYSALDPLPDGYDSVEVSSYTGVVAADMEITFVYRKKEPEPSTEPKIYNFRIMDEYYDADGNVIETVERLSDNLAEGTEYECTALSPLPDGYAVISDTEYRGVVTQDTVITFKYKDASVRLVTVKGYLTDKNGEPIANNRIELHSELRTAVTDANGYYEIKNVETGSHKLSFIDNDGTELIMCDLSITKQNQDTADVTYKLLDAEVRIDLSVANVLQIDAVLPYYKLEVIDKYYDKKDNLTKSELRESLTAVKSGMVYSYDALSPKGYKVTSEKTYAGIVTENTSIVFTYKKNAKSGGGSSSGSDPEPKYYTVTVIDNCYDANDLLIDSAVRLTETKGDGSAYYYDAKLPAGYVLVGADHYSDFVHSNLTLVFAYKAASAPRDVVVSVIDRYVEENGSTTDKVRFTEIKKISDQYYYEAIQAEGYELVGSSAYSGVVTSQLTLIFTYQKKAESTKKTTKANECTITVIDKYITNIPLNDFIVDNAGSEGISDGLNNFNIYSYTEESGDYVYMVRRELRCRDTYTEGAPYKYSALELKNYTCISDTELSGVAAGDVELEFIYACNGLVAKDIPFSVYNSKPAYPYAPEAKTGDLDEMNKLPYIIAIVMIVGIFVLAGAGRRRRYR